ncbi:single-stranded DNA binding protein [Halonotius roseus]|uniref:Single-stranded DNA binding protein n=1 Tax=Halonotius roseus TaxID=2511997 RepID=A0A544QR92_9EURY|nr:single-stranded DNA binding protein [Halonotius roseus]TQQ81956.1 single-stranded DNA binding protein [Halonotius roseus]
MGVIADEYEALDTDVSLEEFREAVEDKVEQMGGLADEETAAKLIAHELKDQQVNGIADIEPGMDEVKFLGKVVSIGDLRTFERDEEDAEDGRVVNLEVADETGRIRISMWDKQAVSAVGDPESGTHGEIEIGDVLRIAGRPKEGYNGVEVSVNKAEPEEDAELDVETQEMYRVEDLSMGLSDVNLKGTILDVGSVRTFDRDDGSEGQVSNLSVGDPTGRIRVTLWDEQAPLVSEFTDGQSVEIVDGYVKERDGSLELHVGSRGAVETIDEDIEYIPETTDIESVEIGQTVDIAGGVIETDSKRTFDRDDGSEGQVRNIRLRDETGDMRVALWGEKADKDIELADHVLVTDAEIQDGWQDDLEASAGWQSTVTVLDSEADTGGAAESTGADSESTTSTESGLSAFEDAGSDESDASAGDDGEPAEAATATPGADGATGGETGGGGGGAAATQVAETVEFTGTVVQAGSPIILDNGTETRQVETDTELRLGEEVTVRGTETDGTIDAEDVF